MGTLSFGDQRLPAPVALARPISFEPPPPVVGPGLGALGGVLVRRKWTILGCLVAVLAVVAVATLRWPETYRSTTTVLLHRQRADPGATPALAALDRLGRGSVLETEVELIKSRRVVGPVVDSLDLHVEVTVGGRRVQSAQVFPAFVAGPEAAAPREYRLTYRAPQGFVVEDTEAEALVAHAPAGSEIAFGGLRAQLPPAAVTEPIDVRVSPFPMAVNGLQQGLKVAPASRDGDILRISCGGPTGEEAQRLCAAIAREYVALRAELQRTEAGATADFLRAQVTRLGDSLAASEKKLEAFKQLRQVVAIQEQATEEVRQYAQLKAQRDLIEAERSALAGVVSRIERSPGGARRYRDLASFPTFLANPTVSNLMTQLATLENQRAELARRRTEQNPELAALTDRIAEMDRQVGSIAREYVQSLGAQVRSLDGALGGSSGRLASYPERQVEAARIEREVAALSGIYGMLETRLREAEVAEAVNQPPVRILDPASIPLRPSSPNVGLNMLLAVVLGLGLGMATALGREYADTRIHDRHGLENMTRLPVLTMIPRLKRAGPVLPVTPSADGEPVAELRGGRFAGGLPARRRTLLRRRTANGREPNDDVALEVFRSLGADLHFVARRLPKGDLRSIAVTSAGRSEGKTYVACNLAIARASFGVHTLLIDADMRAGDVAGFFDLDRPVPGLSELLAGHANAREARRAVRVNGGDILSVMPAGEATPDAAELLDTSYFEAMLAGAQAVYDLVVIDTPPLNVLADATAVVASVDAVLVVVREGMTDGESLELTLERLERAGGNVLGIVFNGVRLPKRFAAYGAYSYGR